MKILVALLFSASLAAQLPSRAAIAGSNQDEAAAERGAALFAAQCAGCHGPAGRGTTTTTDLIRSPLVRTDENGEKLRPRLAIHPPQNTLAKSQTDDLITWLHVLIYAAANRGTYDFLNILTGDPKKGEHFFTANCAACHSVTGDLAGIGDKYDPPVLQSLWLNPRRARTPRTVTVTPPGVSGTLERLDEFNLVLRDRNGVRRSVALSDRSKVEIKDPLQPHYDLYPRLTDADLHNVTAFLASLK